MSGAWTMRLARTWRLIRFELKCYLCVLVGRVKVALRFDPGKERKLEIGAGASRKAGFITCDLSLRADYPFDFAIGLPFPDDSIDLVYAEHVLEHFDHIDGSRLVAECRRVLRPGGVLKLSVPDPRVYVDAYVNEATLDLDRFARYRFGLRFQSRIDYLNHIFYMDGQHRYMFDPDALVALLAAAGFRPAYLRDFEEGLDQEARRHVSLFAAGVK